MDSVIQLDGRCYAAPPWSETTAQLADYPGKLISSARRPGFAAWIMPVGDQLSGSQIYATLTRAVGAQGVALLTRDAFEVAELFIHPSHQGRGLGQKLLTRAVAGRDTAWLIPHPGAPAARLYQRLGWRRHVDLPTHFYPNLPKSVYTFGRTGGGHHSGEVQAEVDPL
ncbi:GNAT superfamily N-acetyltransferase [Actinomadura luteofluorescens]|uniref:GNAT superfamily N-acetyltransferase n=1 Tax=Actinomadura luteofluorescens TaxID=46163 RepID=A0A7Y9EPX8_9ACTN|nr:GNAT family N-acetyltransferase [Actinomadura luteofluorescens]NYD51634.1 GNAT superfamily N-acetyltransferase [Actinomadura luteofluorescens]